MSCAATARALGEAPRTLARWVRRYREHGLAGLEEGRRGRRYQLTEAQRKEVRAVLARPERAGLGDGEWTAAALAAWIAMRFGVRLCNRQAGRLLSGARGPVGA
jgi:transposase